MKRWTIVGLQVLLGLAFLASAILKLTGAADTMREHLEIAPWFWVLTALVEIVGAAGMFAGIKFPRLAVQAGLWIAALMGEPSSLTCGLVIPSRAWSLPQCTWCSRWR